MADFAPNLFSALKPPTVWVELPELPWPGAALEVSLDSDANASLRNARVLRTLETGAEMQGHIKRLQDLSIRLRDIRAAGDVPNPADYQDAELLRATMAVEAMARDIDRELYPEFVVRGWRGFRDVNDVEVPYSLEDCRKVFRQLVGEAEFLLDRVRAAAKDARKFPGYKAPADLSVSLGNS